MAFYTAEEAMEINGAYTMFEEWAEKHNMQPFLDEALELERKQFDGSHRNIQARASIISNAAWPALFNENEPVRPHELCMRAGLMMVYIRVSHILNGWRQRGLDYFYEQLEGLVPLRNVLQQATYTHDRAFARRMQENLDKVEQRRQETSSL